jgi:hypothetical protein
VTSNEISAVIVGYEVRAMCSFNVAVVCDAELGAAVIVKAPVPEAYTQVTASLEEFLIE